MTVDVLNFLNVLVNITSRVWDIELLDIMRLFTLNTYRTHAHQRIIREEIRIKNASNIPQLIYVFTMDTRDRIGIYAVGIETGSPRCIVTGTYTLLDQKQRSLENFWPASTLGLGLFPSVASRLYKKRDHVAGIHPMFPNITDDIMLALFFLATDNTLSVVIVFPTNDIYYSLEMFQALDKEKIQIGPVEENFPQIVGFV